MYSHETNSVQTVELAAIVLIVIFGVKVAFLRNPLSSVYKAVILYTIADSPRRDSLNFSVSHHINLNLSMTARNHVSLSIITMSDIPTKTRKLLTRTLSNCSLMPIHMFSLNIQDIIASINHYRFIKWTY